MLNNPSSDVLRESMVGVFPKGVEYEGSPVGVGASILILVLTSACGVVIPSTEVPLEQASTKIPKSTVRATVNFIRLLLKYLLVTINHHTITSLKLLWRPAEATV